MTWAQYCSYAALGFSCGFSIGIALVAVRIARRSLQILPRAMQ